MAGTTDGRRAGFADRLTVPLRRTLQLAPDRVTAAARGVRLEDPDHERAVDTAATAFVAGFNATVLRAGALGRIRYPDLVARQDVGFAVEGAAMATALGDLLDPVARTRGTMPRSANLLAHWGDSHPYTVHCGFGWAFDRLRRRPVDLRSWCDPLLRWLVYDGMGFAQSFRRGCQTLSRATGPADRLGGDERRHHDQGIGRALWFLVDPPEIGRTIAMAAPSRRADLWGGVGLAATYAGGAGDERLTALRVEAGSYAADLGVGSVAAMRARALGRVAHPRTDAAVRHLTGLTPQGALASHDARLPGLDVGAAASAYQVWRDRVRADLAVTSTRVREGR